MLNLSDFTLIQSKNYIADLSPVQAYSGQYNHEFMAVSSVLLDGKHCSYALTHDSHLSVNRETRKGNLFILGQSSLIARNSAPSSTKTEAIKI